MPGPATAGSMEFRFERPGVSPPSYVITLGADGQGSYAETAAAPGGEDGVVASGKVAIRVGPATLARIFSVQSRIGQKPCETRQKNIAKTGAKTLTFRGDGPTVSCTFNYAADDGLNEAASLLIALAETMQAGERLAAKHRFDRLGLDPEMQVLEDEVKGGRALEVGNIGPVLRSIAEDDRVIDRVRRKAARLLQDSGSEPALPSVEAGPGISGSVVAGAPAASSAR